MYVTVQFAGIALMYVDSSLRQDLDIAVLAFRQNAECLRYIQIRPSHQSLRDPARSVLAVAGEEAPVFTIGQANFEAADKLSVVALPLVGDRYDLVFDRAACWNEVALQLIAKQNGCMRVFLLTQRSRLVTPWEAYKACGLYMESSPLQC